MAFFVREIAETNVSLREAIVQRLLDYFYQIRSGRVCVCVLWIIGEYCTSPDELDAALAQLKGSLGPLPFLAPQKENEARGSRGSSNAHRMGPVTTHERISSVICAF